MAGKRLASLLVAVPLILSLLAVPAGAAGAVGVTIDGTPVRFAGDYGAPFLDSAGRTQVPFRRTLEVFGCTVSWDNPSRTAWAEKDGVQVAVPIGQPWMTVNGHRVDLDTAAQIRDNRTYLPIRPVLEAFGAYVTWDGAARQVVVTTGAALVRVHFLDVGQGDAALIDCGPTEVLIDGGDNGAGAAVAAYLAAYVDGPLDYLIATHPDADHIGGLDEVLAAYPVGEVIDSGRTSDTKTYADYWAAVQAEGCTLSYDEDRILPLSDNTVLSLLETGDAWGDSNACSVVAQLTCGNVQVLFTGDMTAQVEAAALPLFGDIDVLKVAHHGSASSTSQAFLDVVRPECAVISYGQGNRYGHPTAQVLQRLLGQGISVYGTGKSGPIVLTTDGTTYSFNTSVTLTAHDAPSP